MTDLAGSAATPGPRYGYDLGSYRRPVTTRSDDARAWFGRGLIWTYGFNHEEAVACFERAIEADPGCAMAHWGLAYALGPNYNKPWEMLDPAGQRTAAERTHAAIAAARASAEWRPAPEAPAAPEPHPAAPGTRRTPEPHPAAPGTRRTPEPHPATPESRGSTEAPEASAVERALIGALAARYPQAEPTADFSVWNASYADAMRKVYRAFPDDADVAVLFADALMNLTPWALWNTTTGEPADGAATVEISAVLERLLATADGREHPGALHLYIHLMEMSPFPERALRAGDALRDLVPDAGHLRHMPTHLDVLCGDYRSVVTSNSAAIAADEKFAAEHGAMNFYTLYRAHDYHFKIYGAMFLGQAETALEAADQLAAAIPGGLLRVPEPPMADWLEGFVPMKVHVLIRFGRWAELIAMPLPDDAELYCVTSAMLHYGKGIACAATGAITAAEQERALFADALSRVPESRTVFNNSCQDILQVAAAMLDGELEYRKGNYEAAFSHLRAAVELDDGLPYDEPWAWMQPARHAYGALLLEQGLVTQAEAVYRADLGLDGTLARCCQHPGNVWSLHGYHECLTRLGRDEQAAVIGQQLTAAKANADVLINASCYCRLSAVASPGTNG